MHLILVILYYYQTTAFVELFQMAYTEFFATGPQKQLLCNQPLIRKSEDIYAR